MASRNVLLDVARSLDPPSAPARTAPSAPGRRRLATALLACAYDDLGKKPRFLDGEDARLIARELLPARLRVADPEAASLPAVVDAFLAHLEETEVVANAFELRRALDEELPKTVELVRSGKNTSRIDTGSADPVVHQAPKLGRNDPCFCGSGRKFKKCHGRPS